MSGQAMNPYLRDAVLTASPEQLQLMLYDGAIRFASQGGDAIVAKDYEKSYEKFTRAQQIVLEMYKGLNFEVNREICQRMASVYLFIYNKLVDACVRRETKHVEDALKVLRIERETWQLLVDKVSELHRDSGASAEGVASEALAVEG
jgi:flagellar protein FliS